MQYSRVDRIKKSRKITGFFNVYTAFFNPKTLCKALFFSRLCGSCCNQWFKDTNLRANHNIHRLTFFCD